jgi:hypothetical protein
MLKQYSEELLAERPFSDSQQFKVLLLFFATIPTPQPNQSPVQWLPEALSLGVKRKCGKAEISFQSSAYVDKCGALLQLQHVFCLINYALYLYLTCTLLNKCANKNTDRNPCRRAWRHIFCQATERPFET